MSQTLIKLSLIGDTAYCFNVDDYMKLRTDYRILGKLIGCTVRWPRNTSFNGLPAIYSPYETQLLIDKGAIQLCEKKFSDVPDETIDKQYEERLQEQIHVYQEVYREKRIEEATKMMDKILAGKRKKVAKSGGNPDEVTEEAILEDVRNRAIHEVTNVYIQVPTQEPFDVEFEEIKTAPKVESLKYRVFRDLWEKSNTITSGETFGGDFLVYPGDPLYFHASHIVHVLSTDEAQSMASRTFITRTRLSVNVNKLCVFAYENEQSKELCYQTVQWLGK